MRNLIRPGLAGLVVLLASLMAHHAFGQSAGAAGGSQSPADPWPRMVNLGNATATVYQPQVESWEGNVVRFRAVVALTSTGAGQEVVGVAWASAIAHVDRVTRLVTLDALNVSRVTFPAEGGDAFVGALRAQLENTSLTIALDRLKASLATGPESRSSGVSVQNAPPRVFVSDSPAILIPVAGEAVLGAVKGTPFERVINTRALILRDARGFYLHLYDGWMSAETIDGRWQPAERLPSGIDRIADNFAQSGQVDLLDGGTTQPRPSLRNGAPTVYLSHTPAELIVFDGQPDLQPISGTGLLWAKNTAANVIVDIVSGNYYVLISGRWFRSPGLNGPWRHVPARALPSDFSKIPPREPAGAVLASVAGTSQAKDAVIENSIPQTATVPRINGPTFTPEFDGHPQYRPITGTPLYYVANSPTAIIRVEPKRYLALQAGVWFEATSVIGPWILATSVPAAIYGIPPSSPLHYVTYVHIYGATPQLIQVGYTPGYTGTVVTPEGVVVFGTGYTYPPWIGTVYYPPPVTYGIAAQPYFVAAADASFGFIAGAASAAMPGPAYFGPAYFGGAYYPGYGCCYAGAIQSVYGFWGTTLYAGSRAAGTNAAALTSSGESIKSGIAGGQRRGANNGKGQPTSDRGGTIANSRLGPTESFTAAPTGNDHYADVNGIVYRSTTGGWEKQAGSRWERAGPEDSLWAIREQQARVSGADRFNSYRDGGAAERVAGDRFGGGDRSATDDLGDGGIRVGGLRGRRAAP